MSKPRPTAELVSRLVENHRKFRAFLERRVGSGADAEDILQSAYAKGVERGGDLRDGESAVAWFYRLLRNGVADHYRRRARESRAVERAAWDLPESVEPEVKAAICGCISDLLPALRKEYAEILRRVDLEGRELAAVAAELSVTPGNARVRLHRARRALRDRLEESCGSCTAHGCLDCSCGGRV